MQITFHVRNSFHTMHILILFFNIINLYDNYWHYCNIYIQAHKIRLLILKSNLCFNYLFMYKINNSF